LSDSLAPLFTPFTLGSMTVSNRFAMSPMTRRRALGGVPLPEVADYYRRRVEGGVGLIITEGVGIDHPSALGWTGVDGTEIPHMYGPDALAAWEQVVETIHQAGGRVATQLWHQGAMRVPGTGLHPDAPSMRPSGIWGPLAGRITVTQEYLAQVRGEIPAMSEEDIQDIIEAYARSAANARRAGFDAIGIHAAHGYLLDSFLWTGTNLRTDRWGRSLAGRLAIVREVVRAVRRAAPDLPLLLRVSQWKQQDYDARIAETPDQLEALLGPLADDGVDLFDISARNFGHPAFEGSARSLAGWVKTVTGRPTMAVGSIGLATALFDRADGTAEAADNLPALVARFEAGEFDLAGVGRMLIAQPDWVNRMARGEQSVRYDRTMLSAYF
jgi:2,4-dienoyl-CoA reductase-like NADH-dependent reductase (Old Yellow Enzyme family)